MCDLSHMLTEEDLKNLKHVLRTADKVPDRDINKVNNFYELWNILEQSGYVSVGKYDVLIEYLEMMKINKCVIKIREHASKIEEYRERKRERSLMKETDGLSESRTRQMVNGMVASAMQQFGERIGNKIDDRMNNVLEMDGDGRSSGKLEDRISAQITKVVNAKVEDKVNIIMKTVEDRITAKLEDRMKTETNITEDRVNVMMKITADELSAKIADIVNKEVSEKLSAKAQPSTPVVVRAAASTDDNKVGKKLSVKAQPSTPVVVEAAATAEVNKVGKDGKTLLMCAAEKGDIVNVNSLLNSGADPDLKDKKYEYTALMLASRDGHKEIVALLLENNADVNLQKKDGYTALMHASRNGHKEIVALLLENNADVNLQDENGWTALMDASRYGHTEIVALLLENNADVNLQDQDGDTALSLAKKRGLRDIVEMLKAAGA